MFANIGIMFHSLSLQVCYYIPISFLVFLCFRSILQIYLYFIYATICQYMQYVDARPLGPLEEKHMFFTPEPFLWPQLFPFLLHCFLLSSSLCMC